MSPVAARSARELQMLEILADCAHGLGLMFGDAAKAASDHKPRLQLLDAFHKSFLAVRMGIRLCMTLRAPPKAAPVLAAERAEAPDPAEHDPAERERSDCARFTVERERDYEPVSLSRFLATLGVVARAAERLDDQLPAEAAHVLPTLQALLAQASADPPDPEPSTSPAANVAVLARPPQSGTRHKLLGSAATPLPRPRPPPWSGSG